MPKRIDITGQVFGKLTVISFYGVKNKRTYWNCKCSCGKELIAESYCLRHGHTKSCGCYRTLDGNEPRYRHGKVKTRLYSIWSNMKNRCDNPNAQFYKDYGGRGITYCEEWRDFIAFEKWAVANGYKEDLTIDRINNNGNYEPDNCRWTSIKEQQRNRRSNHLLTFKGETHCINEWAEILGISRETIKNRLGYGWDIEKVLTEPIHRKERRKEGCQTN